MKKSLLFLSLISIFFFALPEASLAKKKYRYIKREHGVRFQGNLPISVLPNRAEISLAGSYTYNWKGRIEVGPYFNFESTIIPKVFVSDYSIGALIEYNIVKNRGKTKFIPSVGLKLGIADGGTKLATGVYTSMKFFVATRTSFITTIEYMTAVPYSFNFASLTHNVNIAGGFSYYFDFY